VRDASEGKKSWWDNVRDLAMVYSEAETKTFRRKGALAFWVFRETRGLNPREGQLQLIQKG
jgi:hypothetical protein